MKRTQISESNKLYSKLALPLIYSAVLKSVGQERLGYSESLSGYPQGQNYLHNNTKMSFALFTLFLFISEFFQRLCDVISRQTGHIYTDIKIQLPYDDL